MLERARVLIVEDEAIIAMELAMMIEDADGCVCASCDTLHDAIIALDTAPAPHVAVLDFQLLDGEVTPVAERLLNCGIPLVLHTASPVPRPFLARAPYVALCPKPAEAWRVVRTLRNLLDLKPTTLN